MRKGASGLNKPNRPLSPTLHFGEVLDSDAPGRERFCEDVGRNNRIFDGVFDSSAGGRSHDVGCISDDEKARSIPPPTSAERH